MLCGWSLAGMCCVDGLWLACVVWAVFGQRVLCGWSLVGMYCVGGLWFVCMIWVVDGGHDLWVANSALYYYNDAWTGVGGQLLEQIGKHGQLPQGIIWQLSRYHDGLITTTD